MFFKDNIIGVLEDNAPYFPGELGRNMLGVYYGIEKAISLDTQPFLIQPLLFLSLYIDKILLYNIIILLTLLLNAITAFFLFKKYHQAKISFLLAFTYSVAPFILFKAQNHPTLVATWILNLGLYFILQHKLTIKRSIIVGLYIAFATLASNYYGYFLILFTGVTYTVEAFYFFTAKKWRQGIITILKLVLSLIIAITLTVIAIFPYVRANYLGSNQETKIGQREVLVDGIKTQIIGDSWKIDADVSTNPAVNEANSLVIKRSIEDFTYFTSRPWYYLLPATDNIVFGNLSKSIIDYLQAMPGNWLAQNYFVKEHSASYLGWANIVLALIGIFTVLKGKRQQVLPLTITIIMLFLVTMPPYFTISGFKIYMPSYILSLLFPMFRSLTRLGIIILPLFLIISGYGYQYLFKTHKGIILVVCLFLFSIAEFIVPVKMTPKDYHSNLFIQLNRDLPKDAVLAVYPEEDSNILLFNINNLNRPFINPKGYNSPEFGFSSEQFTDSLTTCNGILEARNLGVTHILIYGRDTKLYQKQRESLRTSSLIESNTLYDNYYSEIFTIKKNIDYKQAKVSCIQSIKETN